MNLGDVTTKVVPKMSLIAPARAGGHVCTRTFIPHDCHAAIGVLGAVSVATACILPGSVTAGIATVPEGPIKQMSVEHPTGEFSVTLEVGGTREQPTRAESRVAAHGAPDHARRGAGAGRHLGRPLKARRHGGQAAHRRFAPITSAACCGRQR